MTYICYQLDYFCYRVFDGACAISVLHIKKRTYLSVYLSVCPNMLAGDTSCEQLANKFEVPSF